MVSQKFVLHNRYSRKKIKEILQSIYDDLKLTIPKATAEHIKKFYDVEDYSTKINGKTEHGFKILRTTLSTRLTQ